MICGGLHRLRVLGPELAVEEVQRAERRAELGLEGLRERDRAAVPKGVPVEVPIPATLLTRRREQKGNKSSGLY